MNIQDYESIRRFLSIFLPIFMTALSMGFVRSVVITKVGSVFIKIINFLAAVVFGVTCGYIDSHFHSKGIYLLVTAITTLLVVQIINKIDKVGLNEIINFIKRKNGK